MPCFIPQSVVNAAKPPVLGVGMRTTCIDSVMYATDWGWLHLRQTEGYLRQSSMKRERKIWWLWIFYIVMRDSYEFWKGYDQEKISIILLRTGVMLLKKASSRLADTSSSRSIQSCVKQLATVFGDFKSLEIGRPALLDIAIVREPPARYSPWRFHWVEIR